MNPDGSALVYARKSGDSTALVQQTIASSAEKTIGDLGDEEAAFFKAGDLMVVSRDTFDSDSEIAVTEPDGKLVTRCTENDSLDTNPAVSPVESDDIDVAQF